MADMMTFPNTVEEFMESYKIIDTEQIYTNGAELVPIFRMKQWFNHKPEQQWTPCSERLPEKEGQYLVTLDFTWGEEIEMGDWFIFEDGHGEWVNPNSHVTVAWMELPTPWKGNEDK